MSSQITYDQTSILEKINNTKPEDIITINVGGVKFSTLYDTLTIVRDNLFHKIIMTKKMDIREGLFIDREPKLFKHILQYLRFQQIDLKRFTETEIKELYDEAQYYEVYPLEQLIESFNSAEYETFDVSKYYKDVDTLESKKTLLDTNLKTGFLSDKKGAVTIKFKKEVEFTKIMIGGYTGYSDMINSAGYGVGGLISVSVDNKTFTEIGKLPSGFGTKIITMEFPKTSALHMRITGGDDYLGIGYLKII